MFECLHPPKIICLRPDFCQFWQGSSHNLVALELFDVLCFLFCVVCGVVLFGTLVLERFQKNSHKELVQGAGGTPK